MLCLSGFELYSRWVPLTYRNLPWSTEPKHRVIALLRWRPLETGHCVFREISTFLRANDYKLYIRLKNGRDRVLSAERFLLMDSQRCTMTKIDTLSNNFSAPLKQH